LAKHGRFFEGKYPPRPKTVTNHDVDPDRLRLVTVIAGEQEEVALQMKVVLKCLEECKQKVPAGEAV
jgi:hypothetical protein